MAAFNCAAWYEPRDSDGGGGDTQAHLDVAESSVALRLCVSPRERSPGLALSFAAQAALAARCKASEWLICDV